MSDAKHTPSDDASFRASLVRNLGGAVGLIVVVALAFWAIGSFGGDDPPVAADDASETDDGDEQEPSPTSDDDLPDDEPGDDDAAPVDDPPDVDGQDGSTDDEEDGGTQDDTDTDGAGDDGDEGADVDPSDVTIQVLDGYKQDGGSAADDAAELLGEAGYQVVARNDALSYEATTVLYNPGSEAAARQVADALGGAEVREQPGNLSTQVDLHVVVGSDRA